MDRLTANEKRIIAAIHLRANSPIHEIAADLAMRPHKVRYLLQGLLERKILFKMTLVNIYVLGLTEYFFYFGSGPEIKKGRENLVTALVKSPEVSWLLELGGDYRFGVGICVEQPQQAAAFIERLSIERGIDFFEKTSSIRLSFCIFQRRYLDPTVPVVSAIQYSRSNTIASIDELDRKILREIMANRFLSYRELAKALSVSNSTIEYRLRKLRQDAVIVDDLYGCALEKFGVHLYRLLISIRGFHANTRQKIAAFSRNHLGIVNIYSCLGNWDYELSIETEVPEQASNIMAALYDELQGDVNWLKLIPVFRFHKAAIFPIP